MAEQRLPIQGGDFGTWGEILNQFIEKEHYNTGTDNVANGGHKTITIRPGTATAGTAPLKFSSGVLLSGAEAGAMEFNSDTLYFTITTGAVRKTVAMYDDASGATGDIYYRNSSGFLTRLPVGGSNNLLKVSGGLPAWGDLTGYTTDDLAQGSTNLYSQWVADSPGIKYSNHLAVGANADVNASGSIASYLESVLGGTPEQVLAIQESATGTPTNWNIGLDVRYEGAFNAGSNSIMGMQITSTTKSDYSTNVTLGTGAYSNFLHKGSGTVSQSYAVAGLNLNTGSGTMTTAYGLYGQVSQSGNGTITTGYGAYIAAGSAGAGTYTTQYGMFISALTAAGTNYGLVIGVAGTNTLWVGSTSDTTTEAGGIVFGSSKDTNLYRSAANTLKTDDNFTSALQISSVGSASSNNAFWASVSGDANARMRITNGAIINFGNGTAVTDTNLYRSAADTLKTDDNLIVAAAGTAANSVVNIDAVQTLTNKTLTLPVISSISNTGTLTLPTSTDTLVGKATTDTLTNKRITPRVGSTASSATPTINTDDVDAYSITAQAADITSFTTNLSGTPTNFQKLIIRIKDDGTARAITWGASFASMGVDLPTTTVISKVLTVGFIYDTVTSKWGCVASAQED